MMVTHDRSFGIVWRDPSNVLSIVILSGPRILVE